MPSRETPNVRILKRCGALDAGRIADLRLSIENAESHVQQPLVQTVVDELLGAGACPSTGASASRTNRVMDELLREYRRPRPPAMEAKATRVRGALRGGRRADRP